MTKPLQLETSADAAYLVDGSGVTGFGPEYDRSEHLHRKASFWQDGEASCVEQPSSYKHSTGPNGAIGPHRPGTVSA